MLYFLHNSPYIPLYETVYIKEYIRQIEAGGRGEAEYYTLVCYSAPKGTSGPLIESCPLTDPPDQHLLTLPPDYVGTEWSSSLRRRK